MRERSARLRLLWMAGRSRSARAAEAPRDPLAAGAKSAQAYALSVASKATSRVAPVSAHQPAPAQGGPNDVASIQRQRWSPTEQVMGALSREGERWTSQTRSA